MPLKTFGYLKGLWAVSETANCMSLSRILKGISHDRLSRILNDGQFHWQTLLLNLVLRIWLNDFGFVPKTVHQLGDVFHSYARTL